MERAVVVHSDNAIFFGYLINVSINGRKVKLRNARNAFYWKCDKGMLQLSQSGPPMGSKIGDRADIELTGVVMIQECTPEAIEAWENRGWEL